MGLQEKVSQLKFIKHPICLKERKARRGRGQHLAWLFFFFLFFFADHLRLLSTTGANEIILKLCLLAEAALCGIGAWLMALMGVLLRHSCEVNRRTITVIVIGETVGCCSVLRI